MKTKPFKITNDMPIIHPNKCCVECRYMYIDVGSPGYSELTPGSEFDMECSKKHWDYERYSSEYHYRECILSARRCTDFEEYENEIG